MEQRKLISAVDYILHEERLKEDSDVSIFNVTNYANFLKQTPNIGDFVPAKEIDGVWIVLEKPKKPHTCSSENAGEYWDKYSNELKEYNEAKTRLFFEGVDYDYSEYNNIGKILELSYKGFDICYYSFKSKKIMINGDSSDYEVKTIEDLVKFNLIVTEQKAKELGL